MSNDTLHVFINPAAGRGRAGRRRETIEALLGAGSASVVVHASRAVGDLEEQVRAAVDGGIERIVVAGGDGSIHEAVNGIMHSGRRAALGVIPTGTGNDFAKACGIPLDWQQAAVELRNRCSGGASLRHIDVGMMNSRYFANGAGVGLDARVTAVARSIRWPIGDLVYLVAIFRTLAEGVATPAVTIESDHRLLDGPITLAAVANGPWIGGKFHIAPMASNSDGRLELIIAAPVTRPRILTLLPALMAGRHTDKPEIRHESVTSLVITASSPLLSHLDGEVQPPASRFEFAVLPAALELL